MSDTNSQNPGSYLPSLVAVFLSVSMSIFFSQLSISEIVRDGFIEIGCLLKIITMIIIYIFFFYLISKISVWEDIQTSLLVGILSSSWLIVLIGVADIRGTLINIMLCVLFVILLYIYLSAIIENRKVDRKQIDRKHLPGFFVIIFIFLIFSLYSSYTYSPWPFIENDCVWLENEKPVENGYINATLCIKMKAMDYDANDIRVKIISVDSVALAEDECPLLGIDILKRGKERTFKWNVELADVDTQSFFLRIIMSDRAFDKKITLCHENGQWNADVEDVRNLHYLLLFLKKMFS